MILCSLCIVWIDRPNKNVFILSLPSSSLQSFQSRHQHFNIKVVNAKARRHVRNTRRRHPRLESRFMVRYCVDTALSAGIGWRNLNCDTDIILNVIRYRSSCCVWWPGGHKLRNPSAVWWRANRRSGTILFPPPCRSYRSDQWRQIVQCRYSKSYDRPEVEIKRSNRCAVLSSITLRWTSFNNKRNDPWHRMKIAGQANYGCLTGVAGEWVRSDMNEGIVLWH